MIRMLNMICVALMGVSILALYHVSEKTRVTHMQLAQTKDEIKNEARHIKVLELEWQNIASPQHVQIEAQRLGMADSASVQLSSFDQLPRKGDVAPLNNSPLRNASAQGDIKLPAASDSGM